MGVSCIAAHSDRGREAFPALSISFTIAAVHNHDRLVVWFILDSNHRYCHRNGFDAEGALYMYPENMHSTFSRHTTVTFSNFKSLTEANTTNGQSSKLCHTQTWSETVNLFMSRVDVLLRFGLSVVLQLISED